MQHTRQSPAQTALGSYIFCASCQPQPALLALPFTRPASRHAGCGGSQSAARGDRHSALGSRPAKVWLQKDLHACRPAPDGTAAEQRGMHALRPPPLPARCSSAGPPRLQVGPLALQAGDGSQRRARPPVLQPQPVALLQAQQAQAAGAQRASQQRWHAGRGPKCRATREEQGGGTLVPPLAQICLSVCCCGHAV